MRVAFLLACLFAGLFYSYIAFAELSFLSLTGRLGPGFFPRLIGVALVGLSLFSLVVEWRRADDGTAASPHWQIGGLVMLLTGVLVVLLSILGGVLAMVVFLLLSLSLLNRRHHIQNLVIALIFPAAVYLLFDVLLNASIPEGLLDLPF